MRKQTRLQKKSSKDEDVRREVEKVRKRVETLERRARFTSKD